MIELYLYIVISSFTTGAAVLLYEICVYLLRRHIGIKTRSLLLHLMLFFQPASIIISAVLQHIELKPFSTTVVTKPQYVIEYLSITPIQRSSQNSVGMAANMSMIINVTAYVWFAVFILLICIKTVKYFRFRNILRKETIPLHSFSRPKIIIAKSKYVLSPFLIGIIRPVVIIPENGLNSAELRLALKHEFAHYRRRDVVFKMFAEFMTTVNFFNPAFYLLQNKLGDICELVADEITITNSSVEKRKTYCKLLLDLAERKSKYRGFCLNLSKEGRLLSERMNFIMENTKRKSSRKVIAAVIASVGAVSVLSVIGYATYKAMPDSTKVVYATPIPQMPVNGFSLLADTGDKLPESFVSCGEDDFFPTYSMYSVSSAQNSGTEYSVDKLAYDNGQVIVLTDDSGSGFELAEGQTVSIKIIPDYSPEYNNDADTGELVCIGYIINGIATEFETPTGRVPGNGLELNFTAQETGTYYFYAINVCAGLQNYEKIEISVN